MHSLLRNSGSIDYFPCRYGTSRNSFRGPRRRVAGDYVACLGGNETFGRDVVVPFPVHLEKMIGMPCINFGCAHAGVDAFKEDHTVLEASRNAQMTLFQVMGAANMSNRYYSVHIRRNDRFVRPSEALKKEFPGVDFSQIHFTHHLLEALKRKSPSGFEKVVGELRVAWRSRMQALLPELGQPLVLVCLAVMDDKAPVPISDFVTLDMVEGLKEQGAKICYVDLSDDLDRRQSLVDPPWSSWLPDAAAHEKIAEQLSGQIAECP